MLLLAMKIYFLQPITWLIYSCRAELAILFTSLSVSLLNMLSIAADRYLYIVHPIVHMRVVTARRVQLVILVEWVVSILLGVLLVYFFSFSDTQNCNNILNTMQNKIVSATYTVLYLLCTLGTGVLYGLIARVAKTHSDRRRRRLEQAKSFMAIRLGGTNGSVNVKTATGTRHTEQEYMTKGVTLHSAINSACVRVTPTTQDIDNVSDARNLYSIRDTCSEQVVESVVHSKEKGSKDQASSGSPLRDTDETNAEPNLRESPSKSTLDSAKADSCQPTLDNGCVILPRVPSSSTCVNSRENGLIETDEGSLNREKHESALSPDTDFLSLRRDMISSDSEASKRFLQGIGDKPREQNTFLGDRVKYPRKSGFPLPNSNENANGIKVHQMSTDATTAPLWLHHTRSTTVDGETTIGNHNGASVGQPGFYELGIESAITLHDERAERSKDLDEINILFSINRSPCGNGSSTEKLDYSSKMSILSEEMSNEMKVTNENLTNNASKNEHRAPCGSSIGKNHISFSIDSQSYTKTPATHSNFPSGNVLRTAETARTVRDLEARTTALSVSNLRWLKQMAVVFGLFLLCWTPTILAVQVNMVYPLDSTTISPLLLFCFANSGVNFFVYSLYNRQFRTAIKRQLTCRCKD
ncbi:uncharacterized protein LOC106011797 [Aplysia californica]|uniref:Uncharacterized protein LOC106011797 n=1 Tax=Aplysia californica TaxID=6500 RepID=A0ABM1A069_APLCA|nr:uncharacterized protein LOC106011797 [Aplysia californica]